jgi:hypothetical protein
MLKEDRTLSQPRPRALSLNPNWRSYFHFLIPLHDGLYAVYRLHPIWKMLSMIALNEDLALAFGGMFSSEFGDRIDAVKEVFASW